MNIDNFASIAKDFVSTADKFCFTGEPEFGVSRDTMKSIIKGLGLKCSDAKCNCIVVCKGVSRWSDGEIGKKLQNVLDRIETGEKIFIISEVDFLSYFHIDFIQKLNSSGYTAVAIKPEPESEPVYHAAFDLDIPYEGGNTEDTDDDIPF